MEPLMQWIVTYLPIVTILVWRNDCQTDKKFVMPGSITEMNKTVNCVLNATWGQKVTQRMSHDSAERLNVVKYIRLKEEDGALRCSKRGPSVARKSKNGEIEAA